MSELDSAFTFRLRRHLQLEKKKDRQRPSFSFHCNFGQMGTTKLPRANCVLCHFIVAVFLLCYLSLSQCVTNIKVNITHLGSILFDLISRVKLPLIVAIHFIDKKYEKEQTVMFCVKYTFIPHKSFTKGLVEDTGDDYSQNPWDPEILYILDVLLGDAAASRLS